MAPKAKAASKGKKKVEEKEKKAVAKRSTSKEPKGIYIK
jgi:hypothetical protein